LNQRVDSTWFDMTISVEHQHDGASLGVSLEMSKTRIERIAFPAEDVIAALNAFNALRAGDSGGVIGAVVGDDDKAIARTKLAADLLEGCPEPRFFVVCGNQHGNRRTIGGRLISASSWR
jgi:hypothetical protein